MSVLGMSNLVAAMVASSGQQRLDVRDHRRLHEALVGLAEESDAADEMPELRLVPDAEVGTRVLGVTRALWELHRYGALVAEERETTATYIVVVERLAEFSKPVDDLPSDLRDRVAHRAIDFGSALEMDLKKSRKPL